MKRELVHEQAVLGAEMPSQTYLVNNGSEPQRGTKRKTPPSKRKPSLPAIVATAATTTIDESVANDSDGTEEIVQDVPLIPPPLPSRDELSGGGDDEASSSPGASQLFAATYGNAEVLGKTLGRLKKFVGCVPLLFNRQGLELCFLEASRVVQVKLFVPAESFVRYEGLLGKKLLLYVPTAPLLKFAAMCTARHTLTFMYDQCGAKRNLHLMLYPRDLDLRSEQKIRIPIPTIEETEQPLEPNDIYQFAVALAPNTFALNSKRIEGESTTMALTLKHDSLEMSSVDTHGNKTLILSTLRVASHLDMTLKTCFIKSLDPESPITLEHLSGYRLSSAFMTFIATFGDTSACNALVLRLGAILFKDVAAEGESVVVTRAREQPLHFRFDIGTDQTRFFVDAWLAPRVNE